MKRQRLVFRALCWGGALFSISGALWNQRGLEAVGDVTAARWMGWGALTFLVLSQAMSAAARLRLISPLAQAVGRRELGITGAALATLHTLFSWIVVYRRHLLEELANTPWLEAGLAAWLLLLLLWVTSYPRLVIGLRLRIWKSLHHLAYVATALAWVHLFDSPWAQRWVVEVLGLLILCLWLLRLVPLPKPLPSSAEDHDDGRGTV